MLREINKMTKLISYKVFCCGEQKQKIIKSSSNQLLVGRY